MTPFKFSMGKINLRSALFVSFALHIVFATVLPSLALNRATPLKEKDHNKVRITMLKKVGEINSPKVKKENFKPKLIREPHKILKVSKVLPKPIKVLKVLPMTVKISKPLSHQRSSVSNNARKVARARTLVPQEVSLKEISSRSHFRKNSAEVKVVQVSPKTKGNLNSAKLVADRSNPKKVALRKVSGASWVSHSSVVPIQKATNKIKDSNFKAPVAAINPNAGAQLKRMDLGLKYKTPSVLDGSVNRHVRSKLFSASDQDSNAVRIASLMPREMAPVDFDEPPKESKTASEAIAQIMNDFYMKVGKQIAYVKIYPDFARKMGYQGKIMVAFRIGRDGKILNLSVSKSSGYKILDEAALEAVKEAGPYPPIPNELNKNFLKLKIPISYALR
jgi:TonB family protein